MTVSASATTTGKGDGPRVAGPRPGGANVRQRFLILFNFFSFGFI